MLFTWIFSERPGTPGRRQQMPRTTRSISTPARLASYSASMISPSTSEFIFIQIAAGRPALACVHLFADMVEDARPDAVRRHRHDFKLGGLGVARDIVEDARQVVADGAVGGEEGQVGIDLGGDRVIVAGAHVAVGNELAPLAPHDLRAWRGS